MIAYCKTTKDNLVPTYTIINNETGEETQEFFTSFSSFESHLKEHPMLSQGVSTSVNIISGTGTQLKVDGEFKSLLKKIKKENKKSNINVE